MPEAPVHWVTSSWSKPDLEGKSVQFDFPFTTDRWVKGTGIFRVNENQSGQLSIWIDLLHVSEDGFKSFCLSQNLADAIYRCVPTSTFDFNLFIGTVPSPWDYLSRRDQRPDASPGETKAGSRLGRPKGRRSGLPIVANPRRVGS